MAIIKCDRCGAMLDPRGIRKQHRTEGELEIDVFFCGKCGVEYIGFISDRKIRGMIQEIQDQRRVIRIMEQKKMREKSIRKAKGKLESIKKSALQLEENLKRRYEEGKIHDTKTAAGAGQENPSGIPDLFHGGDPSNAISGNDPGENREREGLEQDAGKLLLFRTADAEHSE